MNSLGQFLAGERLPDGVACDIRYLSQTFQQSERLKDGCINADTDAQIPIQ